MVGKVQELVLENFKSYEGRVDIELRRNFTCIVGPNGSGKSGLLDAIGFVLCVQAPHLVGDRLKDLVHRKERDTDGNAARIAAVELVYAEGDDASHARMRFRRTIQIDGTVTLQINGDEVNIGDYTTSLKAINILAQARNFLVFQGDVETAARRQGRDLTAFFEQVSGSSALREEYERLATDKALKEERMRTLNTKKRNAINEKKRIGKQKEEAEAYQALETQLQMLQVEFFLFRLRCIERCSNKAREIRDQRQEELGEARTRTEAAQNSLRDVDAQRASARLAIKEAERDAARVRANLDKLTPEVVEVHSKLRFSQDQLEDLQRQVKKEEFRRRQLEEQVLSLREAQTKLTNELQQVVDEKASQKVQFSPVQLEEFKKAQALAEQDTAEDSQMAREIEASIRSLLGDLSLRRVEVREGRARRDQLRKMTEDLKENEQELSRMYDSNVKEMEAAKSRMETAETQSQGYGDEKQKLLLERKQLMEGIQDNTANERQMDRDRTLAQTTATLAKLVPGVHGRVVELCRLNRKYQTALSVALGGYGDAVIVDTFDAGRRCVAYLRDRMLEPMTFLPLDKLRVQPPDQRLWAAANQQNEVVMALKCLSFDQRYARAFEFLLGDTVVAERLEVARRFSFEELRRLGLGCRVVTLDGEVISRDGNVSVSCDAARASSRFDFRNIDESQRQQLRAKQSSQLATIDHRLREIHSLEANEGAEANASQRKVRELDSRKLESEASLKRIREEIQKRERELQEAERALQVIEPQLEESEKEEAELRKKQRIIEDTISKAVSQHFAKLSADMGVDDVRQLERVWRQARGDLQRRENDLSQRLGSVKAEFAMMERALHESVVDKVKDVMAKRQAEVERLEELHAGLAKQKTELEEKVAPLTKVCEERDAEELAYEKAVSEKRQAAVKAQEYLAEVEKRMKQAATEVQTLEDSHRDVLQEAFLEDVRLPRLPAEGPGARGAPEQTEPPDIEGEIDFSVLARQGRDDVADGGQASLLLEEDYRSRLRHLGTQLHRLRPNLKAIDQLSEVNDEAEDLAKDAINAKLEVEAVDEEFETVRTERRKRFMECFEKVAAEIDKIYKKLTANTANLSQSADGGSAYLDLEDTENPFLAGVKFTAIPPAKRFCDIRQLSGGERTLAAIALLFAVHAYRRPPFLVLDEVDAHLDVFNLQAFAGYVASCDMQTVVISLKDQLYTRCEGLVGVSKNKKAESSVVFTVDMVRVRQGQLPVLSASPARHGAVISPNSRLPLPAPAVPQTRSPSGRGSPTVVTHARDQRSSDPRTAGESGSRNVGQRSSVVESAGEPQDSSEDAVAPTEAEDEDEDDVIEQRRLGASAPVASDREQDLGSGSRPAHHSEGHPQVAGEQHSPEAGSSGQRRAPPDDASSAEQSTRLRKFRRLSPMAPQESTTAEPRDAQVREDAATNAGEEQPDVVAGHTEDAGAEDVDAGIEEDRAVPVAGGAGEERIDDPENAEAG